jgi:ubiquitin C-terminal hydrolase
MNLLTICQDLSQDKHDKKLSFALAEVFHYLWEDLENKEYAPNNFKETIGEMNPLFRGIAANDPKDLVIFLMQTIHKELNYPPQKQLNNNYMINSSNFNDVFNEFIQHFTNNNNSIVCEEFYGCSNSMTTCAKCSTTIHNTQAINILIFPLEEVKKYVNKEKSVTIEDCFSHYEKQDIYPSFYCNYCRQLYPAYNQNKLIYTPPTLIINLNRGRGIQYDVGIEFGQNLNIRKYVYAEESPNYYELVGVISHFGSNDMGGHFLAFCKNVDNCNWYKYNDGIVTRSSFQEASNTGIIYVLFYSYIKV